MNVLLKVLVLVLLASPSFATSVSVYQDFYRISKVTVQKVGDFWHMDAKIAAPVDDCTENFNPLTTPTDLDKVEESVDKIINIGEKIWKIVERGRPVVNVKGKVAHALPREVKCWTLLENWQIPRSEVYEVSYENLYGMKVITFQYRVTYTYGGSYVKRGQYLTNVSVTPATVNVYWGFEFDAEAAVERIVNLGSLEQPVAGMEVTINWRVRNVLADMQSAGRYFISGNGVFKAL